MTTRQRKRCGETGDSRPARKRRRLLDSGAGGASQAEPIDSIQSVAEVIDLTGESSGPEVRDLTNDLVLEQSQQYPLVSGAADNPVVLLMTDDEEEPGDNDGIWPASLLRSLISVDENSEQWQQNQQHPRFYRAADNSAVLLMSDNEEEQGDYDDIWPASLLRSLISVDENSEQWQQNQQHPRFYRAADNSAVLLMSDNEEEQGDYDDIWPASLLRSLISVDENSELLEEYEQQRRNITLRSQQQSGSSILSNNDEDEATDNDVARPAGTIRCPICMDFYSEIVQSERLIVSTLCGHVFCSECLPVALEITSTCPTCRTELTHSQYHPIYI